MAHRFGKGKGFMPQFHADKLAEPLRRRKPARILVSFNGDLFDPAITDEQIAAVFGVMAACPQHTFLVLTKRAERMARWFAWVGKREMSVVGECTAEATVHLGDNWNSRGVWQDWPLPNLWLGVSVTNQADADARIPHLLRCQAAVRWVSAEPLLGDMDIRPALWHRCNESKLIHWIVAGELSGPHTTVFDVEWARDLRDQCAAAGAKFCWKSPTGYPPLDGVVHDAVPEDKR